MIELFGPVSVMLVLAMILALVQLLKKLGVAGNWLLVSSVVLGIILGVLLQLAEMYPGISPWFKIVVYGILLGLTASGLYDLGKQYAAK